MDVKITHVAIRAVPFTNGYRRASLYFCKFYGGQRSIKKYICGIDWDRLTYTEIPH